MTTEWILFGVIEPLVIISIAWLAVRWHERSLRRKDERRSAGIDLRSDPRDEAFSDVSERPRSTTTVAERVAELERTLEALLAGASGWPAGLIDPAIRRLEAQIEVLHSTDEELQALSERYRRLANQHVGTTSSAIMIELARRSALSAHAAMSEAADRRKLRKC